MTAVRLVNKAVIVEGRGTAIVDLVVVAVVVAIVVVVEVGKRKVRGRTPKGCVISYLAQTSGS